MNAKFKSTALFVSAALVLLTALFTLLAMVKALTVSTTLAAIESAFGSFVLTVLLLVIARNFYDAGQRQLKANKEAAEGAGTGIKAGKELDEKAGI